MTERLLATGGGYGTTHLISYGIPRSPALPRTNAAPQTLPIGALPSEEGLAGGATSAPSSSSPPSVRAPSGGAQAVTFPNGWVGINSLASSYVPPDPVVAVGPNIVMQVVNSNYEFWTKNGVTSAGPYPLSTFIPAGNSNLGDVQVLYDNMTHRWFMTVDDFTYGSVWICTSTSYDPTSSWYLLNLSIAPAGDYFDRPILGVSDYVLGVGGNVWTNAGGFVNAEWFVINKTMLENNAGYYWWTWTNPAYYAMHPVSDWTNASVGTPGTQLFVSTNSGATPIMIGRVTGGATATPAVLTVTNYAHAALTAPPDAFQAGAGAPYVSVSLSGTQVMNAVWQNGLLWFDFDIGCTPAGDTQVRSCAEYIEFNTVSNTVLNDITQSYAGSYVYYPAIATDWFGDAAVALGFSSSTVYPSLTVIGRNYTYTVNSNEFWFYVTSGQVDDSYSGCTAAPAVCRYGDYFGAAADPSDPGLIWVEGEWEATGSVWSTYIEGVRVAPLNIPTAFWNQTSTNADVGHAMMLNLSDANTQCAAAQSRWCAASFGWGDGSTYSSGCLGAVGTWNAPNKWTNVWNVSHTYAATGNLTIGVFNAYIDSYTGGYCPGTSYQGEATVPALSVRVHRDPTVGVPVPSTTSMDVGQTVTFADPPMFGGTTPALRYTWGQSTVNFGCHLSPGGMSCTPTAPGTYYAAVVVTDALGVTSPVVDSTTVTVYATPTATLGWSASAIDVGQSSTVTATPSGGSGGNTYSWSQSSANLGCTFSNSASAVCTPAAAGAYTASLVITDSNGGGSGTLTSPSLTVDSAVSTTIPAGTPTSVDVGQAVTFSTTASGGSGSYSSYSWTPSSANLGCAPSTTATITCTPTVAGTYTISVVVTDSNGGTATATSAGYTVYSTPTIAAPTANRTAADVGQAVTFTASASGGSGGFTYTWSGLPAGCTGGTAATVSCTVSTAVTASVTVSATDSNGASTGASTALSFTVYADPTTTTPAATPSSVEVGHAVSFSTTAAGGSGGYAYYWSGLPTGCSTANSDPLSCTPSAAGTFPVVVTVIDSDGFPVASSSLSFTVLAGPSVTTPTVTPAGVDVGQTATFSATASGGSGGFTYAWSGLPTGCTGSNAATVPCTPTGAGTFHVGLNVTDSSGGTAASGLLTFVVTATPAVSTPTATPASVDVGQTTSIAATVTGGLAPLVYTWTGLPTGCSGASATVSCTPTAAGTSSVTLKVADANGATATSSALSLKVYALPTLSAPTASPNPVNVGATLTLSTTLTGGAPTDTYSWTGLPTGCSSTNAATLTCTPSTAGTFSTKVSVTDGNGGTGTSVATSVTVSSASGSPTVTLSASPPSITLGATTTLTGSVSGGTTPYTYTWTGLPGGCTSANLASLSCTPTATGTFSITLKVTDAHGNVGQGSVTLTVTPSSGGSPSVSLAANPSSVAVNKATSLTGTVSGGTAPFTYAWTGLPPGCTSQNSATLSCTPTTAGTYTVTLTVTDSKGNTGQGSVSLTVTNPSGGNNNQTSSPGSSLLTSPLVLALLVVAIVAVAAAVLLMRRKRPSSTAPAAPAPAAEPAPSTPAATPASPPPPPPPPPA